MSRNTSPLDNIHIASPCPADWNQMFGDERKRFCGECKLNVYNLSDMTRHEAENLIISSEGRLCVRFFRRADGTILTKNCPVGWASMKRRASRAATAAFSMIAGFVTGVFGFQMFKEDVRPTTGVAVMPADAGSISFGGTVSLGGYEPVMGDVVEAGEMMLGRPAMQPSKKPSRNR